MASAITGGDTLSRATSVHTSYLPAWDPFANLWTGKVEFIIVNNLGQTEFFITKAIGWALRDYGKTDPEWVRACLERHRAALAPLSLREASKCL
jgi:hypothetical protein